MLTSGREEGSFESTLCIVYCVWVWLGTRMFRMTLRSHGVKLMTLVDMASLLAGTGRVGFSMYTAYLNMRTSTWCDYAQPISDDRCVHV